MKFRILFSLKQINKMIEEDLTSKNSNKELLRETQTIINTLLNPEKTQLIVNETIISDSIKKLKKLISETKKKVEMEQIKVTKSSTETQHTAITKLTAETKHSEASTPFAAITLLALFTFEGFHIQQNHHEALQLFELAKDWKIKGKKNTNAVALCYIARCHELGLAGLEKNVHEAATWYELSVKPKKSNFAVAQTWYGALLDARIIGEWDFYTDVTNLFFQAIEQEYPSAYVEFGQCIERGTIGLNNAIIIRQIYPLQIAIEYYRKAGELGYLKGTWHLARCQERGIGMAAPNLQAALVLYHKNSKLGCSMSQTVLGDHYMSLGGDYTQLGFEFYLKAANQGHLQSVRNLAQCFFKGIGTKKDIHQALKWYEFAAKQRCTESQRNLWEFYITGIWHYKERELAVAKFSGMLISDPDLRVRVEKLKEKEIIQNKILLPFFQTATISLNTSIVKIITDYACYPREDKPNQNPFQKIVSDEPPTQLTQKNVKTGNVNSSVKSRACIIQ